MNVETNIQQTLPGSFVNPSVTQTPNLASTIPNTSSTTNAVKMDAFMSDSSVKSAIKQANVMLKAQVQMDPSVSFGYEVKLGQLFVQIHDGKTQQVIGEFPSKSARSLQIAMNEMVGLLLDKTG